MSTRYTLSKKEKKQIAELLEKYLGIKSTSLKKVNIVKEKKGEYEVYYMDSTPILVVTRGGVTFPHLKFFISHPNASTQLPRIWVDSGAVVPVGKGADLMAPGITRIEGEFEKDDIALVLAPNGTPIAVVKTLFSSREIAGLERGKVAKNIHHIGDKFWPK